MVDEGEEVAKRRVDQSKALTGSKVESILNAEEKALENEAKKGMTSDEAVFSVETAVLDSAYEWSDKYRPRKPRYFNRVHTGFEWNKYNQTHYDVDNPPPKIVQVSVVKTGVPFFVWVNEKTCVFVILLRGSSIILDLLYFL